VSSQPAETSEAWFAPAKINLWLEVLRRRGDGYHDVDTAYQAIDVGDTVLLESAAGAPGLECRVEGTWAETTPAGEENLAARAARLLSERTGHALRLRITVHKEIPPGAGLGGGSSDAAATLIALARRFAVPDPERTLRSLAAELGADVPFFLVGGTQAARGIGDDLAALEPPPDRWGILVRPPVAIATESAYGAWDEARAPWRDAPSVTTVCAPALPPDWRERGNDFEGLIFERHPVVRRAFEILSEGPCSIARLAGSGSAVFALYPDPAARDDDLGRVRRAAAGVPGAIVRAFRCIDHGVRPM
jgi:4-diphosphocytidyl-2-C-methyl-D-erythritol kinase